MLQTEAETPPNAENAREGAPTEPGADRVERLLAELNHRSGRRCTTARGRCW